MTKTTIRNTLGALVVLSSTAALAAPAISTTYSTVKVRPSEPAPVAVAADLVSGRNEFVSFQIVVAGGDGGASNVSATPSDFSGPGKLEASNISLYREGYLNLTKTSFIQATHGQYPDPLVPDVDEVNHEKRNAFPFAVPANETRTIWVDVLIPQGTTPGLYKGSIAVTGDGIDQKVPFTVNVVPAELPSTATLKSAFLFNPYESCMAHTGSYTCNDDENKAAALRKSYAKFALEHRLTLSNITSVPWSGDYAWFDQTYGGLIDGTEPSRLPGAKMTSIQYMGARSPDQLKAFSDHMKAKGWMDRAYDYTGDEPPFGISFGEARSRAETVRQSAPELRTLLTTTIQELDGNGMTPLFDLVVPVINFLDGTQQPYQGNQRPAYDKFVSAPNKSVWAYQSCMSHGCAYGTNGEGNSMNGGWPSYMVDASAARNRAMQWDLYAQNVSGELYYETALALQTAWDDVFRFSGNGDGTLFYPGLTSKIGGSTDIPVPSLRLKMIRQGMQDYEWLKLVADAGDPGFAQKVARSMVPRANEVSDNGFAFENARRQLIARYIELKTSKDPAPAKDPIVTQDPDKGGSTELFPVPVVKPGKGGDSWATATSGGSGGGSCSAGGLASSAAPMMGLGVALASLLYRRRRKS